MKKFCDRTPRLNHQKWATPIHGFSRCRYSCFSAPGGRRDLNDSAKCSQWPYLYKTYEATYTLKGLVFEEIAKNRFLAPKLVFRMLFKKELKYLEN